MPVRYADFLATKRQVVTDSGRAAEDDEIHPSLFPFQRDITRWALRKGRSAVFADTGLGKTRMQLEWARLTGGRTLILAPLAVARQTISEAASIGVSVEYAANQGEVDGLLTISNYERLHLFDPDAFDAVVLDESSILKAFTGATRRALTQAFANTKWRLACTATPAPNDYEELCNHAEFLGVCTREAMLAMFFVHDEDGWRLKRHARTAFFRWLASWAMAVKVPSDLGYEDDRFTLPPLNITPHYIKTEGSGGIADGMFATRRRGVAGQNEARRATLAERVAATADLIAVEPDEPWLMWCGLNDESDALTAAVPGAVQVQGSDTPEAKADALTAFAEGRIRVLVTKAKIAGFGMNFQHCACMAFCGLGYSYEQYYQALRRCWRFGQTRPVEAHIVLADVEADVYETVIEKERQAQQLSAGLLAEARDFEMEELAAVGADHRDRFEPSQSLVVPSWIKEAS